MLFHSYIVRAIVFSMAALIGSLGYYVIGYHVLSDEIDKFKIESDQSFFRRLGVGGSLEKSKPQGTGCGGCDPRNLSFHRRVSKPSVTENYKILSKPKAAYTPQARAKGIEGTVRLKVILLSSGEIGRIIPAKRLSYGLTEQAMEAARNIKFKPKRVDGMPKSAIATVEYRFEIN